MKYCSNCGAEIPEGTKFCPNCGTKVVDPVNNTGSNIEKVTPATKIESTDTVETSGNDNKAINPQQTSGGIGKDVIKLSKNKIWRIIAVVAVVVIVGFLLFTRTSKYRDMTTSNEQKTNQVIGWANQERVLPYDYTVSLSDHEFILMPNQGHNVLSDVLDIISIFSKNNISDSDVRGFMTTLSSKISHQWGSKYVVKLGDTDDSTTYVMKAQNGKITYDQMNQ
jgi:uncharacterized Zn finger protein (UPF0148 family)